MAIDALVFDLDGTLVDSAADIAEAVNRLFDALALPRVDAALVRGWIGDGVSALVATALAHQRSALALEQALPLFMSGYHDCLLRSPRLYPGVAPALASLQQAGVPMAICTNKPAAMVAPLLQHLGIAGFFAHIIGGDSLPQRKPDPAPLRAAFAALGSDPAAPRGIFVGDSEFDVETASNTGVPMLLFLRGYRKTPVEDLPHRAAFDDFRQLPALVEDAAMAG